MSYLFDLPKEFALYSFIAIHAIIGSHLFFRTLRIFRQPNTRHTVFWASTIIVTLLCGAYFEYPADPWAHAQSIFNWEHLDSFRDSYHSHRFAYFWDWTLLRWLPPIPRWYSLDVLASFWLTLTLYQVYLLSRDLGFSRSWSQVQCVAFLSFFGTNLFSFRYYAISATPLAFISYLAALRITIRIVRNKETELWKLPLLLLCCYFNHLQEVFLYATSAIAIGIWFWGFRRPLITHPKLQWAILISVVILGATLGTWMRHFHPEYFRILGLHQIAWYGGIKVWSRTLPYAETLGLHGAISLALSVWIMRSNPLIALLSLIPFIVIAFPLSTLSIAAVSPTGYIPYRILFAFPTSITLVWGLRGLIRQRPRLKLLASAGLLIMSLVYAFPFRGRLFFQFYRPPEVRTLKQNLPVVNWLYHNRDFKNCIYLSDDQMAMTLNIFGDHTGPTNRSGMTDLTLNIREDNNPALILDESKICGFLLLDYPNLNLPITQSRLGLSSKHWDQDPGNIRWHYNGRMTTWLMKAEKLGWKPTQKINHYILYETN